MATFERLLLKAIAEVAPETSRVFADCLKYNVVDKDVINEITGKIELESKGVILDAVNEAKPDDIVAVMENIFSKKKAVLNVLKAWHSIL